MSYNLEVPHRFLEKMTSLAGSIQAKNKKSHSNGNSVFHFESEMERDFCAECLDLYMDKSSSKDRWAQGTIVMGKDQSYRRSEYEVLADNGCMLLLLFRRYVFESGRVDYPDFSEIVCIRRKDNFAIHSDHSLRPSGIEVSLPEFWVSDFRKIKLTYPSRKGLWLKSSPQQVYDQFEHPNGFKVFADAWNSKKIKEIK